MLTIARWLKQRRSLLDSLGIEIDASVRTERLDLQQCKLVEIAKAMYWQPKILVVDETTTALSQTGRNLLYKLMRKWQMKAEVLCLSAMT